MIAFWLIYSFCEQFTAISKGGMKLLKLQSSHIDWKKQQMEIKDNFFSSWMYVYTQWKSINLQLKQWQKVADPRQLKRHYSIGNTMWTEWKLRTSINVICIWLQRYSESGDILTLNRRYSYHSSTISVVILLAYTPTEFYLQFSRILCYI